MRNVFYFGPFTLDAAHRCLFRRGIPVRVTSKALALLNLLVRNAGTCLSVRECWYTHLAVDPLVRELGLEAARLYAGG